ncbi:hypothetical protein GDO78_021166 [Eleutherodactylus coqui]|uniref:Vertebrate heat shock transcription factor C-terminal domain-containing protein n=1 Tax=Eleutherodactylus coqui TaxID=57060 RepID=A0A8J6BAS1_ELECQ|nr:hypothetical protein GDO78_021166 [Eleutherodactylus coqui]
MRRKLLKSQLQVTSILPAQVYRVDLQDFLSCIDASLEELQSIFSQKKLSVESDVIDELFKPDLSSSDTPVVATDASIVSVSIFPS